MGREGRGGGKRGGGGGGGKEGGEGCSQDQANKELEEEGMNLW